MTYENQQDEYAKDGRDVPEEGAYKKSSLTPAESITDNQDKAMFTGCGANIEPPEIGDFPTAPLSGKGTKEKATSGEDDRYDI